jgi:hypothetical protein
MFDTKTVYFDAPFLLNERQKGKRQHVIPCGATNYDGGGGGGGG